MRTGYLFFARRLLNDLNMQVVLNENGYAISLVTLDCSPSGCTDERGNHRALGDTWPDFYDPCVVWVCTRNGTADMPLKHCDQLPPPPNSHCRKVEVDCCDTWDCSIAYVYESRGCTFESGHYNLGDTWPHPKDNCTVLTCNSTGITRSPVICPPISLPPKEGCKMVKEQCCYVWKCRFVLFTPGMLFLIHCLQWIFNRC